MVLLPLYQHIGKKTTKELIPLPEQITELYISKAQMMITGMFRGTSVIAIAQGLAMGVVHWITGMPNATFFTLLSMVSALLPVVGRLANWHHTVARGPDGNATSDVPPANGDQTDPSAEPASPKSDV